MSVADLITTQLASPHPGGRRLRITVISSFSRSLVNFRLELLKRLAELGHEVIAFGPERDNLVIETLATIGVRFVQIPMSRTGTNPVADCKSLFAIVLRFWALNPDMVLAYTMKPIIYGGIAARLMRVPQFDALVTGLGHVFADPEPRGRDAIVRRISIWLYRVSLKRAHRVFVYNDADEEDIRRHALITDAPRLVRVPGSGVDLEHYRQTALPAGPPVFILIARLLRDKGIYEYVEASRQLRRRYPAMRSCLLGQFEPHDSGVKKFELDEWSREGVVNYLGEVRDVRPYLANSSVFVLPSYYREGIPRSILEAMAAGRPIITADSPGCRDTVSEGENGFVVPPRDAAALALAMERFITDPQLGARMGQRSRELAREKFDVHAVNRLLMSEMGLTNHS